MTKLPYRILSTAPSRRSIGARPSIRPSSQRARRESLRKWRQTYSALLTFSIEINLTTLGEH